MRSKEKHPLLLYIRFKYTYWQMITKLERTAPRIDLLN